MRYMLFCLGLLASGFLSLAAQPAGGAIRFEGEGVTDTGGVSVTLALGKVPPADFSRTITIRNVGSDTLRVIRVQNSGGSIISNWISRNLLAPGDTALLSVIGSLGHSLTGSRNQIIHITTSDPERETIRLTVRVWVERRIIVGRLGYLMPHPLAIGVESEDSLVLKAAGDSAITIYPPNPNSVQFQGCDVTARFNLTKPHTLRPGQTFMLKIYVTPRALPNREQKHATCTGFIRLRTSSSGEPEIPLTILIEPYLERR